MRLSRLRRGEVIAGGSAIALLALMLFTTWFQGKEASGAGEHSWSGWEGLGIPRWLVVLAIAACLLLALLQAACRAPAIPASMSVIATVLSAAAMLWLVIRIALDAPGGVRAPAVIALIAGAAMTYGSYSSMRTEGISEQDAPRSIPIVKLDDLRNPRIRG